MGRSEETNLGLLLILCHLGTKHVGKEWVADRKAGWLENVSKKMGSLGRMISDANMARVRAPGSDGPRC